MQEEDRCLPMASCILLHKENSPEFRVTERAVKMRRAILFELSRRTVIDRAVDTAIESPTVMLLMYRCSVVLMLRACLNWHLVTLRAQTLPRIESITTVRGTSLSRSTSD